MTTSVSRQAGKPIGPAQPSLWIPPRWVEYTYYFTIFYSLLAGYLGIELPLVAAGITVALAGFCYRRMRARAKEVYAPIAWLLACQISFILVQIAAHGASPMEQIVRDFILWICGMIIVQSLCLRRGFLQRFTVVLFVLGLVVVPKIGFTSASNAVERVAVEAQVSGNLSNANGLAGWFGFCVISFAIAGLKTKNGFVRILCWIAAAGSLLIVGLTVSRGVLLGVALALAVGFRRFLKGAFFSVVVLIILVGLMFVSGLIDPILSRYLERGTEETGRFLIWPAAIERIYDSPIVGVGADNVATYVSEAGKEHMPHNSFLYFALASGILPATLWIVFWIRAGRRSFFRADDNPFRVPFFLYALSVFLFGSIASVSWALVTLSVAAGSVTFRLKVRRIVRETIQGRRAAPSPTSPIEASNLK